MTTAAYAVLPVILSPRKLHRRRRPGLVPGGTPPGEGEFQEAGVGIPDIRRYPGGAARTRMSTGRFAAGAPRK